MKDRDRIIRVEAELRKSIRGLEIDIRRAPTKAKERELKGKLRETRKLHANWKDLHKGVFDEILRHKPALK